MNERCLVSFKCGPAASLLTQGLIDGLVQPGVVLQDRVACYPNRVVIDKGHSSSFGRDLPLNEVGVIEEEEDR